MASHPTISSHEPARRDAETHTLQAMCTITVEIMCTGVLGHDLHISKRICVITYMNISNYHYTAMSYMPYCNTMTR